MNVVPIPERKFSAAELFMIKDLARSGLTQEQMFTIEVTVNVGSFASAVNCERYLIPYFYRDGTMIVSENGKPLMYRIRKNVSKHEKNKYDQPSEKDIGALCRMPYFHPNRNRQGKTLLIVEGEKKSGAVVVFLGHLGYNVIGIGGCWNYLEDKDLHPEIAAEIEETKPDRIVIVPDADWRRLDISRAYGTLFSIVRARFGVETVIADMVNVPEMEVSTDSGEVKKAKLSKIDDYLAAGGNFVDIPQLDNPDVSESADHLIRTYNLISETRGGARNPREVLVVNHYNLMELLRCHPIFSDDSFYLDEDRGQIVFRGRDLRDGDDCQIASIFEKQLAMVKVDASKAYGCLIAAAQDRKRSTLREYLARCGDNWDGKSRIDGYLHQICRADNSEYVNSMFRYHMLGAVARKFNPGCKYDSFFTLVGGQGTCKSTFFSALHGVDYTTVIYGKDTSDKDLKLRIGRGWCCVFEEMHALMTRDLEMFKALITTQIDVVRPPYARVDIALLRQTVLTGTSNDRELLREFENRRDGPVFIPEIIDLARVADEKDQLWGEAVRRYRAKEQYWDDDPNKWFDEKDAFRANDELTDYVQLAISELPVTRQLNGYPVYKLTAVETSVRGKLPPGKPLAAKALSEAMKRAGYEKLRKVKGSDLTPPVMPGDKDGYVMDDNRLWVRVGASRRAGG